MNNKCRCNSNQDFHDCCGRFLSGNQSAATPEQLMRSRYTAFALGGYGSYLLQTWFPATAQGITEAELSNSGVTWLRLQIDHASQQGDSGTVTFRAWFINEQQQPCQMLETSMFIRQQQRWYYVGGEVIYR